MVDRRADELIGRIGGYIKKNGMIPAGTHVIAGVSGGADSVFLLLVLNRLKEEMGFSLGAVHVEHGIRGEESMQDAAFTEALCAELSVPCRVFHVDAPAQAKQDGTGLEEAARKLRYRAYREVLDEARAKAPVRIAVAHHMEDNAETMLFHLARGTGIAGLAGIPPVRAHIIRPLLEVSRAEIEAWLLAEKQEWRTDESNADTAWSRNRIRANVLPELTQINHGCTRHMSETAALLRDVVSFMDREAEQAMAQCLVHYEDGGHCGDMPGSEDGGHRNDMPGSEDGIRIKTVALAALHPALREHLLLRLLKEAAGSGRDLTRAHVSAVSALAEGMVGKQAHLPYGITALREYETLLLKKEASNLAGNTPGEAANLTGDISGEAANRPGRGVQKLTIPGETIYGTCRVMAKIVPFGGNVAKIPRKKCTKWMDYDKINSDLHIRPRAAGDYLVINAEGGRKSIQDYMVNEKIPASERDGIPLIADGSHILWVVGHRISEACKVTSRTKRILVLEAVPFPGTGHTE